MTNPHVAKFFASTPLLSQLCDQNGWIDEDSLSVRFLNVQTIGQANKPRSEAVYEVRFEEILKEGSGCECGRNNCWGKFGLSLSGSGEIISARILAGTKTP